MKSLLILALCFGFSQVQATEIKPVKLHLVGDSTMSDKPNLAYPERGWGQLLPQFLLPQLTVVNHAANGRSTRRFLTEGRWQLLLSELGNGDYVLIQFGHNDSKQSDPARYAAFDSDYQSLLKQFIANVRSRGATPMLASSICRRNFAEDGSLKRDLADYASAAAVAGAITPVPGGVGPMTIACLLANTVTACCRANGLAEPEGLTA